MIQVTDISGLRHFLAPAAIAQVTEAGPSAAWHGVKSFITLFDGKTIEAREECERVVNAIHIAQADPQAQIRPPPQ